MRCLLGEEVVWEVEGRKYGGKEYNGQFVEKYFNNALGDELVPLHGKVIILVKSLI